MPEWYAISWQSRTGRSSQKIFILGPITGSFNNAKKNCTTCAGRACLMWFLSVKKSFKSCYILRKRIFGSPALYNDTSLPIIFLSNFTKFNQKVERATQRAIVISEGATRHFVSIFDRLCITNGQRRKKCKMISWPKAFSFISRYLDLRQYYIPVFQNSILV